MVNLLDYVEESEALEDFMKSRSQRSQSLKEVRKARRNSEVEIIAIASYSSQLQLSLGSEIPVRLSVCLSVNKNYGTSRHLIFPKLGQKLEDNK